MTESKRRAGRVSSRDQMLDAAAALVAEHGVQYLTIERAAAAAGVTKPGLLYHFKTRDDLLMALVEHMVVELDVRSRLKPVPEKSLLWVTQIKAQLEVTLNMPDEQQRLLRNMLTAVVLQPQLLPPVQALFKRDYEALETGTQSGMALLINLALDCVPLLELLQLYQLNDIQRESLRDTVLQLAEVCANNTLPTSRG